jgi:CBS domain-containing protein
MTDESIDRYTVSDDATLEEALAVIESNEHRCVVVLDGEGRAVGTLSDGDIRKALLGRRLLSTPVREVMNLNFVWVAPDETAKAPELFKRHRIFIIPVLGPGNKLLDVLRGY